MADPEARVVVSARDSTAAAFASAEKHLGRFARSVVQMKTVFAGFGVIVSGRMFANWIKDAIEVEKLTVDQAAAIGNASKAVGALNTEFQNIARTAAAELAPSLERAAKFWKEFFFPSGSQFGPGADALREQVDSAVAEVDRLQTLLNTQQGYSKDANWFQRLLFGDGAENVQETTTALAAARVEVEKLGKAFRDAMGGASMEPSFEQFLGQIQYDEEMRRLADIAKGQDLSPEIAAFVSELERAEKLTDSMATDVEKQLEAWHDAQALFDKGLISGETLTRVRDSLLQPIDVAAKKMKELKKETEDFAKQMGENFRDAFGDWILGADRSFKDLLKRMAVDMAVSGIFDAFASMFAGSTTGIGKFFSSFFGGSRANEGPVSAGMVYKVHPGEAFFAPGMNGDVRHLAGAGGMTFAPVTHIDARGADPGLISRLPAILEANNRKVMAQIQDLNKRGRF